MAAGGNGLRQLHHGMGASLRHDLEELAGLREDRDLVVRHSAGSRHPHTTSPPGEDVTRSASTSAPARHAAPGALDLDGDERLWVPQSESVSFRPLLLSVSQGYFANILRVRKSGVEVPADVAEMVTLFHVTGAYVYVDPDGAPTGVEDVFTKLENARQHDASNGIGLAHLDALVR